MLRGEGVVLNIYFEKALKCGLRFDLIMYQYHRGK